MIYGANGYTGQLIAQRAVAEGHRPILAGRDAALIQAFAEELCCPQRTFPLEDPRAAAVHLADVSLVLNCAGPFIATAKPMIEACLTTGTHYLDITGEWKVIEHAAQQTERAKAAGITVMPAVGFDVVPSDCLAHQLATALPNAENLELAFQVSGGGASISPGTATTVFSQLGEGTYVRASGRIEKLSQPWQATTIHFPSGDRTAVAISWGDIASAFYSTGVPNIRVYQAISRRQLERFKRWNWLLPMAGWAPIQWLGRRWIKRNIPGPNETERAAGRAEFWGRVTNSNGEWKEASLATPEGYTLTSYTSIEIVKRVLAGEVPPGFSTPAKAFGGKFIEQFAGVQMKWMS